MEVDINRNFRWYQKPLKDYMLGGGKRAIEIAHRRWGKDEVALAVTCQLAHKRIGNYGHCLPEYAQAKKAIWKAVNPHTGKRRIDEAFPQEICKTRNDNEMFIELHCGSTWQVLGSDQYDRLVGTSYAGLVFSEWALANPSAWGYVQPILTENNGWAMFITTPRGDNHAKTMLDSARNDPRWHAEVSSVLETKAMDAQALEDAKSDLIGLYGEDMGQAQFEQEYLCSFSAAILGAFYGKEMSVADKEGRISSDVPVEPDLPVHRAWDLGMRDSTAIWWFQLAGNEIRIVDYYEAHSQGLLHYAEVIEGKGYPDGSDIVPHDAKVRELGSGKTRIETMTQLGLRPKLVTDHKQMDGINAARLIIPRCWFSTKCKDGVNALKQYRREWDDERKTFKNTPYHDWTSHGADAFRYLAMGYRDIPKPELKPQLDMRTIKEMTFDELLAAEKPKRERV